MLNIKIDTTKIIKEMKPMHGVGQPPLVGIDTKYFSYLKDAHIPFSRLHDVGGWFGGNLWVDIPNVFRNFDADENDPESYDFTFTDILIKGLVENNCKPIYRLGVTIENFQHIKAYRIFPPKDMKKWAVICEHIIRHYNEGWADGYYYDIEYWEIWNEPDNGRPEKKTENMMWKGTAEEFYELYRVTSGHLRSCFGDKIKIGGYGHSGFYVVDDIEDISKTLAVGMAMKEPATEWGGRIQYFIKFFDGFIDMVVKEKLPFDFFSHHSYADVEATLKRQIYVEERLKEAGLSNVEIHLNEWNNSVAQEERRTLKACSKALSMMIAMQNRKMEMMCFYDARMTASAYAGLFNPLTCTPVSAYYGFKAFGELYILENQVECSCERDGMYALAAFNGQIGKAIVVNNKDTSEKVCIEGVTCKEMYLISESKNLEKLSDNENVCVLEPYETVLAVYE